MPVVDCHTHVFPPEVKRRRETFCMLDGYFGDLYSNPAVRIATVEDLLSEMESSGVEVSVMCGFGWASPDLCAMHNDYMLQCLKDHPGRLSALAAVQPLSGDVAVAEIERCLAGGMRGAGELMPDGQGYRLSDVRRIGHFFQYAVEANFPVMTHGTEPVGHDYPGKESVTPSEIWPLVQAYPEATLILAHWGGGYPFYELMPEVREASRNVYYDSAATTYLYHQDIFVHLSRIAGPHKLLFASDYPVLRQGRLLQRVKGLSLPPSDLEGVLGGNAVRVLGLSPAADRPARATEDGETRSTLLAAPSAGTDSAIS